jgi:FtsP/CotA-like multicopper oxidase with cupredoxin domain
MTQFDDKRRQFLQFAAFGTMAAAWPGFLLAEAVKMSTTPSRTFKPDVEIELTARVVKVSLKTGTATKVFKYHGKLLKGPSSTLSEMPSYLGPQLNFMHGQKVRISAYNDLPVHTGGQVLQYSTTLLSIVGPAKFTRLLIQISMRSIHINGCKFIPYNAGQPKQ